MDLLLQAAKVLELEQSSDVGSDRVLPRSTRGSIFQPTPRSRGENSENSDGSLSYSENGLMGGEDDAPLAERRRAGGAGTREVHNQLEKNRRKQLRECFSQLQQVVPSLENKRVATQSILQGAIKHIKNLKKKDVEQEREIQMLAKRKSELKKKYDIEFNKCTEEQHRAAEVILQAIRSRSGPGAIVPPPAVPVAVAARVAPRVEEDGHTSDSTTTASEGPCNEGDFSEDEVSQGPPQHAAYPVRLERKRKSEARGSAFQSKAHFDGPGVSSALHRKSGSFGSKSLHHLSSSVSSSSLALKHMLEQKKKNQESIVPALESKHGAHDGHSSSKAENFVSNLRPVAPTPSTMSDQIKSIPLASKGSAKSASSLTSSYPMISNHLASSIYKPILGPQGKSQPSTSPLVDIWTTSTRSLLGTKAPEVRTAPVTPVKVTGGDLASSVLLKGEGSAGRLLQSSLSLPSFSSPGLLGPIFTSTAQASVHSIPSVTGIPTVVSSNNSKFQLQQAISAGLKTPEAKRFESPFILSPKTLPVLQSADLQGAALLGKNIIGSNTSIASLQPMAAASPLSSADWSNSKIVNAIIPLTPASFLRGMPLQGGVGPLASFASGAAIPVSVASMRNPITTTSWVSVSPNSSSMSVKAGLDAQAVKIESHLGSHNNSLLGPNTSSSSSKQDPLSTAMSSLSSSNTSVGSLLAAGGVTVNSSLTSAPGLSNTAIDLSNKQVIGSVLAQTSASTSPSAAATVTLSLPDGLKPMSFASTFLPLTWTTNVPLAAGVGSHTGATISGAPAGQLRLFAPLSQTASLTNGQSMNGLMPTVVQLGTSGQMALLQHHPHLQVQTNHPQHLFAQPIVVMTTQTSSGPLSTSHTQTGLASVSGASLNTTVSSSSLL
ncbi:hypothetical protein EGW08_019385 [Elysia chlorotica]|uniref:BHLH domain-containing protein n=1 Tax=Elysia chlorotica TaxID=188477 RepID=A0A3S1BR27_ELYCH|nr:hypothetical protein EGW08_019385 [Elysia chlorotica]